MLKWERIHTPRQVSGRLSLTRVLVARTYLVPGYPPTTSSAGVKDLVIEQGAVFKKTFKWLKEDGSNFGARIYGVRTQIRSFEGGPSIASSTGVGATINIDIAHMARGEFTVIIPSVVTAEMNFTRAVYDIEIFGRTGSIRFVEGDIIFSKEVTEPAKFACGTGHILSFRSILSVESYGVRSFSGSVGFSSSLGCVQWPCQRVPSLSGNLYTSGDPSIIVNKDIPGANFLVLSGALTSKLNP
jgi:hypothetical protein